MTIRETIEAIRRDARAELPAPLEAEGVSGIAYYAVGYPENQDDTWCCVRFTSLKEKESFEFVIHLALPGVSELGAYGYMQAVKNYLDGDFDPAAYGYDSGEYDLSVFETDFGRGDIQALFTVTLKRVLDDCD